MLRYIKTGMMLLSIAYIVIGMMLLVMPRPVCSGSAMPSGLLC